MYWQDETRRDARAHGRGGAFKTILSQVTIIEDYRLFIVGYGWVSPNGYRDIPLNTDIYLVIAENGKSWFLADWMEVSGG